MSTSDATLVERYRCGNQQAAAELFDRYAGRIRGLAKSKFSPYLNARIDPDDIVQSVFHSFFRRAREGQYEVPDGQTLWNLLLVIALNKVRSSGVHHRATKRDTRVTVPISSETNKKSNAAA